MCTLKLLFRVVWIFVLFIILPLLLHFRVLFINLLRTFSSPSQDRKKILQHTLLRFGVKAVSLVVSFPTNSVPIAYSLFPLSLNSLILLSVKEKTCPFILPLRSKAGQMDSFHFLRDFRVILFLKFNRDWVELFKLGW